MKTIKLVVLRKILTVFIFQLFSCFAVFAMEGTGETKWEDKPYDGTNSGSWPLLNDLNNGLSDERIIEKLEALSLEERKVFLGGKEGDYACIHHAASRARLTLLIWICDQNIVDINIRNENGFTPYKYINRTVERLGCSGKSKNKYENKYKITMTQALKVKQFLEKKGGHM